MTYVLVPIGGVVRLDDLFDDRLLQFGIWENPKGSHCLTDGQGQIIIRQCRDGALKLTGDTESGFLHHLVLSIIRAVEVSLSGYYEQQFDTEVIKNAEGVFTRIVEARPM